jgi:hypothetical protein
LLAPVIRLSKFGLKKKYYLFKKKKTRIRNNILTFQLSLGIYLSSVLSVKILVLPGIRFPTIGVFCNRPRRNFTSLPNLISKGTTILNTVRVWRLLIKPLFLIMWLTISERISDKFYIALI